MICNEEGRLIAAPTKWKGEENVVYRVRRIMGYEKDESAILAKRAKIMSWPVELRVGGIYYLDKHKQYKVEELVRDHRAEEGDRLPEGELPRSGKRSHPGVRRPSASSQ